MAVTTSTTQTEATVTKLARTVVIEGLVGPTQIANGPKESLLVAQLNGEEDGSTGQVVLAELSTGARRVLLSGLAKPTGVAWMDNTLYVMVQRGLIRATWDGTDAPVGPKENILTNLPFNGRSEGTLTPLPDGRLLYETSGNLVGRTVDTGKVESGSGNLFVFDPNTGTSNMIAIGTKHAYSHALADSGLLWMTEINAGPGAPPPDELNAITLADVDGNIPNLGWPRCPSNRKPNQAGCESISPAAAVLPPGSTPTGVVVANTFAYVALFSLGTIIRVPIDGWLPGDPSQTFTTVVDGLDTPHTLLVATDGRLLVSEHNAGRILAFNLASL